MYQRQTFWQRHVGKFYARVSNSSERMHDLYLQMALQKFLRAFNFETRFDSSLFQCFCYIYGHLTWKSCTSSIKSHSRISLYLFDGDVGFWTIPQCDLVFFSVRFTSAKSQSEFCSMNDFENTNSFFVCSSANYMRLFFFTCLLLYYHTMPHFDRAPPSNTPSVTLSQTY